MPIYGESTPQTLSGLSWTYGGGATDLVDAVSVIDGQYATCNIFDQKLVAPGLNVGIPTDDVIEGIYVRLYMTGGYACPLLRVADRLRLAVSEDGGGTWNMYKEQNFCSGMYLEFGNSTDMWGIASGTESGTIDLQIAVWIHNDSGPLEGDVRIDYWGTTIYTSSGGGGISVPVASSDSTRYVPGVGISAPTSGRTEV